MRYVTFFFSLYYVFEIQYALSHQLVQQISIWTSHIASAQNHMWLAATILDSTAIGGSTLLLFWLQPSSWGQGICEAKGTYVPRSPHLLLDFTRYLRFSTSLPKGSTVHFQDLHGSFLWIHHRGPEGATLLRVNYAASLCTPRLEEVQRDACLWER